MRKIVWCMLYLLISTFTFAQSDNFVTWGTSNNYEKTLMLRGIDEGINQTHKILRWSLVEAPGHERYSAESVEFVVTLLKQWEFVDVGNIENNDEFFAFCVSYIDGLYERPENVLVPIGVAFMSAADEYRKK